MNAPFLLHPPTAPAVPLVFDSPHSGSHFPDDFDPVVSHAALREGEDMFVHELFDGAPAVGASLLEAHFARTYIDPNRHAADVDLDLLDGPWPHEHRPSGKARIGKALVWRTASAPACSLTSRRWPT
jgi:N-formylglutamate deformylase